MTSVLIVTGNKLVLWSLKEILAQDGVPAEVAQTTKDALAKIADHPYNLIIVDAEARYDDNIQEQIDGISPATHIILLSSLVDEQPESFLKKPNICAVIEKPFSVGQIKAAVRAALSLPKTNECGEEHSFRSNEGFNEHPK